MFLPGNISNTCHINYPSMFEIPPTPAYDGGLAYYSKSFDQDMYGNVLPRTFVDYTGELKRVNSWNRDVDGISGWGPFRSLTPAAPRSPPCLQKLLSHNLPP